MPLSTTRRLIFIFRHSLQHQFSKSPITRGISIISIRPQCLFKAYEPKTVIASTFDSRFIKKGYFADRPSTVFTDLRFYYSKSSDDSNNPIKMAENRYAADYDKLGRASCKKCKQKLPKGEMRIAKVVANFFHDGEGVMKQYHHPKCMFETFIKARATTKIIEGPDDLEGFAELKDEDKDAIKALIAGEKN